jgi:hypothetical protein
MKTRHVMLVIVLSALVSVLGWAEVLSTLTEDFEGTLADAYMRSGPGDEIVQAGGNPGAFLRSSATVTPIPVLSTVSEVPWIFTGNFRILGVTELGIDVNVFAASDEADGRPVSLGLVSGDCELVLSGKEIPRPGSGWKSCTFRVPAWKPALPAHWVAYGTCASWPPDNAWDYVMQRVTEARFYVGDPGASYATQVWDIGFDNARVTRGKRDAGPTFAIGGPAIPVSVVPDPTD